MAAPKGNEFWKLRLKHGRDAIIQSHEQLLENFEQYRQAIFDNPIIEVVWMGKDAEEKDKRHIPPMLKPEFATLCGLSEWRLIEDLKKVSVDFSQAVTHIDHSMSAHNIKYAAVGLLNSNIVSRLEKLSENIEQKVEVNGIPDWLKDDSK